MRFHLKRALQVTLVVFVLFIYVNFFFSNRIEPDDSPKNHSFHNVSRSDRDSARTKRETPLTAPLSEHFSVYPSDERYADDRILAQLQFVPQAIQKPHEDPVKLKKIVVYDGLGGWGLSQGQEAFVQQKCPVSHCQLTGSHLDLPDADVVVFQGSAISQEKRPPGQIWALFMLESPYHTPDLEQLAGKVNWTATYRHDSTIVAPYEKFVPYNASIVTKHQTRSFAEGKTKKVAWFVSNCGARNKRQEYAEELAKYIQVDVYGACGTLTCPRHESSKCFDMLNSDYKFYLSFENSNCRDYITEKFFINGLKHDVLPIVMGAAIEDYERAAPPHSFIHVDQFESPKELAEYLHKLDNDDNLYNEYFQWKGTSDTINTFFWCRLCALANDKDRGPSWYTNVEQWWRGSGVCIGEDNWRKKKPKSKLIASLPVILPLEH